MLKIIEALRDNMTQEEKDALEAKRLARQNDPMRRTFNIMLENQRRHADTLEQEETTQVSHGITNGTPKLIR